MKKLKLFPFVYVLLALVIYPAMALASPSQSNPPANQRYVHDFAGIIDEGTKSAIQQAGAELERKTTAQVVAVTVKSLEGDPLEEYATQLFRGWGIGQKDANNGVLLLVAVNDRAMRIEVGYGLEGALPDGKTGRIQDELIIPYFLEDDYSQGIKNGYLGLVGEVAKEYDVQLTLSEPLPSVTYREPEPEGLPFWALVLIFIAISSLFYADHRFWRGNLLLLLLRMMSSGGRRGGGGGFGGGGGYGGGSSGGGGSSRRW